MARIRICPKCKKSSLKSAVNVSGWLTPDLYECSNCNYIGPLFIEIDPKDYKEDNNSYEGDRNNE